MAAPSPWRPTPAEVAAARNRKIGDVVAPDLEVLFCGINPGLYSAAVGHNFARPGNRFWRALHGAGFTDRVLSPFEERDLLHFGLGITNLVERATASASELSPQELRKGARLLESKARRFRPHVVAVLGVGAYRTGFLRPRARIGPQREAVASSRLWVLPNPSGVNAHFQLPDLVSAFSELRREVRSRP